MINVKMINVNQNMRDKTNAPKIETASQFSNNKRQPSKVVKTFFLLLIGLVLIVSLNISNQYKKLNGGIRRNHLIEPKQENEALISEGNEDSKQTQDLIVFQEQEEQSTINDNYEKKTTTKVQENEEPTASGVMSSDEYSLKPKDEEEDMVREKEEVTSSNDEQTIDGGDLHKTVTTSTLHDSINGTLSSNLEDDKAMNTPSKPIAVTEQPNPEYHSYTVYNGISNQILIHAANIAYAIKQKKEGVNIPNAFIANGENKEKDDKGHFIRITPTKDNSIELSLIFDTETLIQTLNNKYNLQVRLVEPNPKFKSSNWLQTIKNADDIVMNEIISQFKPSAYTELHINMIMKPLLQEGREIQNGVCLHHRGGQDWVEHCKIWTTIPDGVWRKNCDRQNDRPLYEVVKSRAQDSQWFYYVGDYDTVPTELKERFSITSKEELLGMDLFDQKHPFFGAGRDMKALADSLVCNKLPYFIGNSVSTWSAIQLAQRKTQASWYNSRSIPLAQMWKVYEIPIVYTYTEDSHPEVKHLLKVSILSVKKKMPQNVIHILYHKNDKLEDLDFQEWLDKKAVLVYFHDPSWKNQIEDMRKDANETTVDPRILPTLQHSGSFFGTWQKIDIPNFIFSEYCLYMSHDIIIKRSFQMIDFGLQITATIAFTSYENQHLMKPRDTSVVLMNIPHMRETFENFTKFVFTDHSDGQFSIPSTVEGAYVDYYRPEFLDPKFGRKVYWETNKSHKIMT